MILFINTAFDDKEISLIKDKKIIKKISPSQITRLKASSCFAGFDGVNFRKKFGESENLLLVIDKILREGKAKTKDLKKIIVVKGPGNFTALRVGIVIANTLAYILKIPVYGIKSDELKDLLNLKFKSKRIQFVMPFYGKEPNITIS